MLPEDYENAMVGDNQAPDQSLRKKLNGMFSRYNYVGVKNPLKKPFLWAVALEQNEVLGMSPADTMNEERMAQSKGGSFLPGDSVTRGQQKITRISLEPGEKKMITGEAAYVIVPRIFSALVRERYGTTKSALAKLRNPSIQAVLVKEIVTGPVIDNIGQAVQTFVNKEMEKQIDSGFSDVQTKPSGFSDPAVLAKAKATREANKAAKAQ